MAVETVFLAGRVFEPSFSRGSFRLGAAVVDDPKGVRVTAVEVESPAYDMRRVGGDDRSYYLQESNSIITHVNGVKVRSAVEFDDAIASSPKEVTLAVFSTTRHTSTDFRTQLRD